MGGQFLGRLSRVRDLNHFPLPRLTACHIFSGLHDLWKRQRSPNVRAHQRLTLGPKQHGRRPIGLPYPPLIVKHYDALHQRIKRTMQIALALYWRLE